jgi:agmatine deiminase
VVGPDGAPRLLDFIFNAWGGKFDASLDNQLSAALHRQGLFGTTPLQHIDMVFEGGSIDSDGCGTLLTTTQCLLAETRNPGWTKENIEDRLQQLLGAQRILWLEHGMLMGDDTDSHVDMLARFCSRDTICYTHCDDSHDDHYGPLAKMAEELAEFRQANGNPYRLLPLPWPQAKHAVDGRRLPASYANFLVINDAVIVPTYGDPADEAALQVIGQAFPGREVIGINSLPLIHQSGSIHCATMQLPAGVLPG